MMSQVAIDDVVDGVAVVVPDDTIDDVTVVDADNVTDDAADDITPSLPLLRGLQLTPGMETFQTYQIVFRQ